MNYRGDRNRQMVRGVTWKGSTCYSNYLEGYWPCAGGLSVSGNPFIYHVDVLSLQPMCVCVCVFFPFILDIKFVGRISREPGSALSGGYAPDPAKAEGSSIVDEPGEG